MSTPSTVLRFVATAALCAAAAFTAFAQGAPRGTRQTGAAAKPGTASLDTKHLTVTTSASSASVARGGKVELFVDIAPKPKMHVYSPEQKDYIPVSLSLEETGGLTAGAARFPQAEKYFFAPLKETQLVYSKPFRVAREVTIPRTAAAPAELTIKGTLRYQACDDAICYLPQQVGVSWKVLIK